MLAFDGVQILEDMRAAGVEFNGLTHSLMVESCVVQNDAQAAVDVYFKARAAGKVIQPETFEKLVARCERSGAYNLMVCYPLTHPSSKESLRPISYKLIHKFSSYYLPPCCAPHSP